uniref:Reverse transcriptase domain-containing protein n=1 Tax=Ananas comosus var. bracteatus TaxID=296719 RepID=A0A6V7NF46_ANACO|nr:unnamed protein product [Ananas comosus var. bracteatus]
MRWRGSGEKGDEEEDGSGGGWQLLTTVTRAASSLLPPLSRSPVWAPTLAPDEELEQVRVMAKRMEAMRFSNWIEAGELARGHLQHKAWIRLYHWPLLCWNEEDVKAVISGFGELWDIDPVSDRKVDVSFFRVFICCQHVRSIPEGLNLMVEDRRFLIPIEIESWEEANHILLGEDLDGRLGLEQSRVSVVDAPHVARLACESRLNLRVSRKDWVTKRVTDWAVDAAECTVLRIGLTRDRIGWIVWLWWMKLREQLGRLCRFGGLLAARTRPKRWVAGYDSLPERSCPICDGRPVSSNISNSNTPKTLHHLLYAPTDTGCPNGDRGAGVPRCQPLIVLDTSGCPPTSGAGPSHLPTGSISEARDLPAIDPSSRGPLGGSTSPSTRPVSSGNPLSIISSKVGSGKSCVPLALDTLPFLQSKPIGANHSAPAKFYSFRRSLCLAAKNRGANKNSLQRAQGLMCKKLKLVRFASKSTRSLSSISAASASTDPSRTAPTKHAFDNYHSDLPKAYSENDKEKLPMQDPGLPLNPDEIQQILSSYGIIDKGAKTSKVPPSVSIGADFSRGHWVGNYTLNVLVKRKTDGKEFLITNVYNPTCPSLKATLFQEIRNTHDLSRGMWAALGDFNVLLSLHDKNEPPSNISDILLFREVVNDTRLIDLPVLNKSFTWTNGRRNPTFERFHRVLISQDWHLSFPRSTLKALPRPRFESFWLRYSSLLEVVSNAWNSVPSSSEPNQLGVEQSSNTTIDFPEIFGDERVDLSPLHSTFTMEEVKKTVFSCAPKKAPGPDSFLMLFYHRFWSILKGDILKVFNILYCGPLDLNGINRSWVCPIPKKLNVSSTRDLRPISLVHSMSKIISKVLASRLQLFMNQLVNPYQTAFIKGVISSTTSSTLTFSFIIYTFLSNRQLF